MLWDKGVGEFVKVIKAGCRIKAKKIKARFVLVGDIDTDNPKSVSQPQIDKVDYLQAIVEQWARCENMEKVYKKMLSCVLALL